MTYGYTDKSTPAFKAYEKRFTANYGEIGAYGTYAYDAAIAYFKAVKMAKSTDPAKVKAALLNVPESFHRRISQADRFVNPAHPLLPLWVRGQSSSCSLQRVFNFFRSTSNAAASARAFSRGFTRGAYSPRR